METSSRESLSMMISTPLASWCGGINQASEVCSANSRGQILRLRTISHRKRFCELTKTFAAFAVRRDSQRGFIGLLTIAFEKMRAGGRNLWESTRNKSKGNRILRLPILV